MLIMTRTEETFSEKTLYFYCLKFFSGPQIMLLRATCDPPGLGLDHPGPHVKEKGN